MAQPVYTLWMARFKVPQYQLAPDGRNRLVTQVIAALERWARMRLWSAMRAGRQNSGPPSGSRSTIAWMMHDGREQRPWRATAYLTCGPVPRKEAER